MAVMAVAAFTMATGVYGDVRGAVVTEASPTLPSNERARRRLAAERLAQAVLLLDGLPAVEQERLLELALEQAAAAGSWGLVAQILDQQLALVGSSPQASARAAERRLRLSGALDDAYGEWLQRRGDPASLTPQGELERQLRSPRSPGGHAASPPSAPQP